LALRAITFRTVDTALVITKCAIPNRHALSWMML
jgi:hypothetical protein